MRTLLSVLIGAALVAPVAAAAKERLSPEVQLAKALEGRDAGPAERCIDLKDTDHSIIIPGEAIIYKDGGTLWVNRPTSGARALSARDIVTTRTLNGQLCSNDTIVMRDRYSRAPMGTVFLGAFVPYRNRAE